MSAPAIRIERLAKRYRVVPVRARYDTLSERLGGALRSVRRWGQRDRRGDPGHGDGTSIWALKGISLEIPAGEIVGIIGANGAGKSTLLKILTRVTPPTAGYAEVRGRVGSLLEVGTGFHPELTGRENVYLNGAILGLRNAEIGRRFDEIVAFSGVEAFIDTPVKYYSSGMYMRLAFAVAAHLEPDILIIDEVLAVGDAQFQRKCLGKMEDISRRQGRTVLFVSHNLDAIQRLCRTSVLLENGELITYGESRATVARYLAGGAAEVSLAHPNSWIDMSTVRRTGSGDARFAAVRFSSPAGSEGSHPYPDGPLEFSLAILSEKDQAIGSLAVTVYSLTSAKLVNADTLALGRALQLRKGVNMVRLQIEELHLTPGRYTVGLWLANPLDEFITGKPLDHAPSAFTIEVVPAAHERFVPRPSSDGVVTCRLSIDEEAPDQAPAFLRSSDIGARPGR